MDAEEALEDEEAGSVCIDGGSCAMGVSHPAVGDCPRPRAIVRADDELALASRSKRTCGDSAVVVGHMPRPYALITDGEDDEDTVAGCCTTMF